MVNAGFMLLLSGAVLTVLGIAFHRPLLYLFGASEVTYPYASSYIVIYLIGTLCVMLSLGLNPYINCQGFARTGMLTVALGAAANIVLDPIFIFALHLAACAALLSRLCCRSFCLLHGLSSFNRQKAELKLDFRGFRPDWHCIQRITVLGIASFVMSFTDTPRAGGVQCYSTQFRRRPLHQRHDCIFNSVRQGSHKRRCSPSRTVHLPPSATTMARGCTGALGTPSGL